MTYTMTCPECGNSYTTKKWNQQYCSKRCVDSHQRLNRLRLTEFLEKKVDPKERCNFNYRLVSAEIERLMELKK